MAEPGAPIECGLAVVHPWLCDAMGHLTTRHYLGIFDDALYQLFTLIGYDPKTGAAEQWGWADVRHEIDYRSELTVGAVVRVVGHVTGLGRSSITSELQLLDRANGRLCASLTARTVCFDLAARRARPLPEAIIEGSVAAFGISPTRK